MRSGRGVAGPGVHCCPCSVSRSSQSFASRQSRLTVSFGDAQRLRGLFHGHPAEEPHLDHPALAFVDRRQRLQCAIESQKVEVGCREPRPSARPAAPCRRRRRVSACRGPGRDRLARAASVVPRCRGSARDPATAPPGIHEAQEGLVDERRGLQRVAEPFAGHIGARQAPELGLDQGQ